MTDLLQWGAIAFLLVFAWAVPLWRALSRDLWWHLMVKLGDPPRKTLLDRLFCWAFGY